MQQTPSDCQFDFGFRAEVLALQAQQVNQAQQLSLFGFTNPTATIHLCSRCVKNLCVRSGKYLYHLSELSLRYSIQVVVPIFQ